MGTSDSSGAETTLVVPQGTFELRRYPARQNELHRAWDAADEYALLHLNEVGAVPLPPVGTTKSAVLVVNDAFGALGVALGDAGPTSWSDSLVAHEALRANSNANVLAKEPETIPSTDSPGGPFKVVVLKVPKSNALLEEQLLQLRASVGVETMIVAAGMVKHIHTSTLEIFERVLGPTHTSLAKKKARLIFTKFDPLLTPEPSQWPKTWKHNGVVVFNQAGVFSATKLDVGTRFLLENLPSELPTSETEGICRVVDLGCGNGIVGTAAAALHPQADITFIDESYLAVASARDTFQTAFPDRHAQLHVATRLNETVGPVHLILSNPPFHQNQATTDAVAWQMFNDAHRCLASNGELWAVGNRHLGYHTKLKRIFGNCETIKGNRKFVVLRAKKSSREPLG